MGLVTAACFAEMGHRVVARDIVSGKIDALRTGRLPFYEPGLTDLIERNSERLTFTTDMDELVAAGRLIFICV
ncbi:MAG: nucleotide sugar dehydrogenase, partial [Solirubrobacterales bacterium]|nr:nucleotide sugar dehydrogenase [Solirubrobacterales bacterium]